MVKDARKLMIDRRNVDDVVSFRSLSDTIRFDTTHNLGQPVWDKLWDMQLDTHWITGRYIGEPVHPE